LGYALQLLGRREEAIEQYQAIFEFDPTFVWAHNNYASLLQRSPELFPTGLALEHCLKRLEDAELLPNASADISSIVAECRHRLGLKVASYASVDDLIDRQNVLVPRGASWRYFVGVREPSPDLEWTTISFDDSSWPSGRSGFGVEGHLETVVEELAGAATTLYLRYRFEVTDAARVSELRLRASVRDGLVVYLNGREAGRLRAGATGRRLPFTATADWREWSPDSFRTISFPVEHLREGENVLALQALEFSDPSTHLRVIPILEAERELSAERQRDLLARGMVLREGGTPEHLVRYFEGRVLQRGGVYRQAETRFAEAATLDASRPEPFLAISECLTATDRPVEAEESLRRAFSSVTSGRERLWDAWLRLSLAGLKRTAREMAEYVAGISEVPSASGEVDHDGRERLREDLQWLFGELESGGVVRINCGGADYRSAAGVTWHRDRFSRGGYYQYFKDLDGAARLHDDALYQNLRVYWESTQRIPAYRVPVPVATYRVTLHFIEGDHKLRRFDVWLEGERKIADYAPADAGFGVPDQHAVEIAVTDGALDIDLARRNSWPCISGLEIERIR
jgi:tetratricopeptide (TPR) repeat protein